jgi:hypothetical protein
MLSDETGISAAQFAQKLVEKGIETCWFFPRMHEQPFSIINSYLSMNAIVAIR